MQVPLTEFDVTFTARDDAVVAGRRADVAPDLPDPARALRHALEHPHQFPPLRRAILPDDLIAVVVDERLPRAAELLVSLLEYVVDAGVAPDAISLISAPGSAQAWIDDLPDSLQDVRAEVHDPIDRKRLSYVASTRKGRRIYLNRTLMDAGQTIFLGGCRYDPLLGHADAASLLFPALGAADAVIDADRHFPAEIPGNKPWPMRQEADEVAWLIGVPFLVHAIAGSDFGVAHIVAGTNEETAECRRLLDLRWRVAFTQPRRRPWFVGGDPAARTSRTSPVPLSARPGWSSRAAGSSS